MPSDNADNDFGNERRRRKKRVYRTPTGKPDPNIPWYKQIPLADLRKFFFIRIGKGDAEQVAETLEWGADPNWRTRKGTPAIVKATRGLGATAAVVELLINAKADHTATDATGLTALDHVRRRLLKYEGKPRKPIRRSPSLTAGGELIMHEFERRHLDKARENPSLGEEFVEEYIAARRKAAERVWDMRGELERMAELLEPLGRKGK